MIQKLQAKLGLDTINVETLVSRSAEGTITVEVKTLRGGDFEYILYWKDKDTANGDAGLMVECELAKSVMQVKRISPKILSVLLERW